MASSSKDHSPDRYLQELKGIKDGIQSILDVLRAQQKQQEELSDIVCNLMHLVDGFTQGGSSFRAYQVDPLVVMYASILGHTVGDRLDNKASQSTTYEQDMIKGAIPYAQMLLRELDEYRARASGLSYLEHMAGDLRPPDSPEPPAAATH